MFRFPSDVFLVHDHYYYIDIFYDNTLAFLVYTGEIEFVPKGGLIITL